MPTLKLGDFGESRALVKNQRYEGNVGTTEFMAPGVAAAAAAAVARRLTPLCARQR